MDRRGSTFNLAPPPAARTRTRTALAPPSSAPFSSNSVIDEVARRQRENGQATGGGGGDLISSADSWSMTREREETYRREVEAQIRAEMAMEDEMRAEIEQQVRREAEEEFRREQDKMREDMERKLRREMELSSLRASPKAASLSSTTLTSSGPSRAVPPPPTRRKGHARQHSVTNSARELRGVPKSNPRQSPQMSLRRPLPPPPPSAPPPRPLSPRTVAAIQIQSQVRRWRARRMMKQLRRRVASVAEIWSTEEQYVAKLRLFQSVFFAQIRASESAGLINPSDMGLIFNNWDDVVIYNTELLRQLRARCATFRAAHCVGDIFLGMRHFSSIYSTFLAGYDKALKVVFWHVENNPGMAKVIKQCEKQLGNTIESYLILPVQRIPRYVLLLRATLGETHRDHPDYALCTQAADKMEAVGTAVNERRREYEAEEARHRLLKEYGERIYGCKFRIPDESRQVLRPLGELVYYDPAEAAKRTRYYIVFSDAFLLLEAYKSPLLGKASRLLKYRVVAALWLTESTISDVGDGSGYLGITAWNSLELHSSAGSFYFFMKSFEEKKEVLALIAAQIAQLKKYK